MKTDDEGDGDALIEFMSDLRRRLEDEGYTPELDADLDRARRSHPLFFDDLVRAGLIERPLT